DRVFAARLERASRASRVRVAALFLFLIADVVFSGFAERAHLGWMRWAWPRDAAAVPPSPRSLTMSFDALVADIRVALRHVRSAPAFALLTTLSLAVGIGANTAIFSVVNAVLLRPLPYSAPDRLVAIWSDNTKQAEPANPVSPANYEAFKGAKSF